MSHSNTDGPFLPTVFILLALAVAAFLILTGCKPVLIPPGPVDPTPALSVPAQETQKRLQDAREASGGVIVALDAQNAPAARGQAGKAIVAIEAAQKSNLKTIAVIDTDVPKVYKAVTDLQGALAKEQNLRVEAEQKNENHWKDVWAVTRWGAIIAAGGAIALGFWLKDIHLGLSVAAGAGVVFAVASFMGEINAFFRSAAWTVGIAAGVGTVWFIVEVLLRWRKTKDLTAAVVLSVKTSPLQDWRDATADRVVRSTTK